VRARERIVRAAARQAASMLSFARAYSHPGTRREWDWEPCEASSGLGRGSRRRPGERESECNVYLYAQCRVIRLRYSPVCGLWSCVELMCGVCQDSSQDVLM
jgi:hypothetical protein